MVFRKLQECDISDAKQLWMESFGDSEDFVHFYFQNKFKLENSMGAFIKNTLVGDITMQEYNIMLRNSVQKTGFLAGCATNPEFRNQGIMRGLLLEQLAEMNKNGFALCHLHPFLHAFYRKFGWETVSYMYKVVSKENFVETYAKENVIHYDKLIVLYKSFVDKFDGYFLRSPEEMSLRIGEHINDGGKVLSTEGGYAVYFVLGDKVDVIEMVAADDSNLQELLSMLAGYGLPVGYYVPDTAALQKTGVLEEYTMMRIVNAKKLFQNIRMPDARFTIEIQDDFCEWNNTSLLVEYKDGAANVNDYTGKNADARVDIRELGRLAAGKNTGKNSFLNGYFTDQKTCFFNTY